MLFWRGANDPFCKLGLKPICSEMDMLCSEANISRKGGIQQVFLYLLLKHKLALVCLMLL